MSPELAVALNEASLAHGETMRKIGVTTGGLDFYLHLLKSSELPLPVKNQITDAWYQFINKEGL